LERNLTEDVLVLFSGLTPSEAGSCIEGGTLPSMLMQLMDQQSGVESELRENQKQGDKNEETLEVKM
jgi:hypothetical protein